MALLAGSTACSNIGLLDQLENPGGKETFTDRLYIFVTSQTTAGDMFALNAGSCSGTGPSKADCVCQALAAQNGLRRSATSKYLAWLSATGAPMNCRLAGAMGVSCPPSGPSVWYNTNNEVVFNGIESATTGILGSTATLAAAPKYTEKRVQAPSTPDNVWTGTDTGGGVATGITCNDWTTFSSGVQARTGSSDSLSSAWTQGSVTSFGCDLFKHIYCVAVP